MSDRELAGIERRLDRAFRQTASDPLLSLAAGLASIEHGMAFPVGLLVRGCIIRGAITGQERFAGVADSMSSQVLDAFIPSKVRNEIEGIEQYRTMFSERTSTERCWQAEDREVAVRYEPDTRLNDIAEDDVASVLRELLPLAHITIGDATLQIGADRISVGVLRVAVASIDSWWPLTSEPNVVVNFNLGEQPDQ